MPCKCEVVSCLLLCVMEAAERGREERAQEWGERERVKDGSRVRKGKTEGGSGRIRDVELMLLPW